MKKLTDYTKEQRKNLRVVRSHTLGLDGMMRSITYVTRDFEKNTVTTEKTIIVVSIGGAKLSLLNYIY